MKRRDLALSLLLAYLCAACGESGILGGGVFGSRKKGKKDSGAGESEGSEETGEEDGGGKNRKIASKGTGFLLKSALQLDNTIKACLGGGRTTVKGDMLYNVGGGGQATEEGGSAFLSPTDYAAGDNILLKNSELFDGKESDLRTGVRAGILSVTYLTALQNAGNAVAFNCSVAHLDVGTGSELCECETEEKAKDLMARCLPEYEPDFFDDIASDMADMCANDQKKAIASFVASLLFAKEP